MSSFYGNLGGGGNGQGGGSDAYNLANEYSNTLTYNIGDYCIYNNILYKCNTNILSNEDWNSTHWDAIKVTDEIGSSNGDNTIIELTREIEQYKGSWDSSETYNYNDIVIDDNFKYYISLSDENVNNDVSDSEFWEEVSDIDEHYIYVNEEINYSEIIDKFSNRENVIFFVYVGRGDSGNSFYYPVYSYNHRHGIIYITNNNGEVFESEENNDGKILFRKIEGSLNSNTLIVPLTFVPEHEDSPEDKDEYRGAWSNQESYSAGDIVSVVGDDPDFEPSDLDHNSYSEGDVVRAYAYNSSTNTFDNGFYEATYDFEWLSPSDDTDFGGSNFWETYTLTGSDDPNTIGDVAYNCIYPEDYIVGDGGLYYKAKATQEEAWNAISVPQITNYYRCIIDLNENINPLNPEDYLTNVNTYDSSTTYNAGDIVKIDDEYDPGYYRYYIATTDTPDELTYYYYGIDWKNVNNAWEFVPIVTIPNSYNTTLSYNDIYSAVQDGKVVIGLLSGNPSYPYDIIKQCRLLSEIGHTIPSESDVFYVVSFDFNTEYYLSAWVEPDYVNDSLSFGIKKIGSGGDSGDAGDGVTYIPIIKVEEEGEGEESIITYALNTDEMSEGECITLLESSLNIAVYFADDYGETYYYQLSSKYDSDDYEDSGVTYYFTCIDYRATMHTISIKVSDALISQINKQDYQLSYE